MTKDLSKRQLDFLSAAEKEINLYKQAIDKLPDPHLSNDFDSEYIDVDEAEAIIYGLANIDIDHYRDKQHPEIVDVESLIYACKEQKSCIESETIEKFFKEYDTIDNVAVLEGLYQIFHKDHQPQISIDSNGTWTLEVHGITKKIYLQPDNDDFYSFIIGENSELFFHLKDPSEIIQKRFVQCDGLRLQHIASPSNAVIWQAIESDGLALQYVKNPSYEMQMAAMKSNGLALQFIADPTDEMKMAAIKSNGYAIRFINNPPDSLVRAAIDYDPYVIFHVNQPANSNTLYAIQKDSNILNSMESVKDPSEQLQLQLVEYNPENIFKIRGTIFAQTIKKSFEKLGLKKRQECHFIFSDNKWYLKISGIQNPIDFTGNQEEFYKIVINSNPHFIKKIKDPSAELILQAIKKDGTAIQYISDPSDDMKMAAIESTVDSFPFIKDPSEQIQLKAIEENEELIVHIKNPSERIKLEAVKKNSNAIRLLQHPSEEIQQQAVCKQADSIQFINEPTEKVQLIAVEADHNNIKNIKGPTYSSVLNLLLKSNNYNVKSVNEGVLVEKIFSGKVTWEKTFLLYDDKAKVNGLSAQNKCAAEGLDIGSKVLHNFFGKGSITDIDHNGYALIQFESGKIAQFHINDIGADKIIKPAN